MKLKKRKQGFTLVEIMIVVAIIGLLAAIGIPSIVGAYSNAQERSMARNVTEVEKVKAMATLPADAGGISATNEQNVTDWVLENLNVTAADLEVAGRAIVVNPIGTRASYAAP